MFSPSLANLARLVGYGGRDDGTPVRPVPRDDNGAGVVVPAIDNYTQGDRGGGFAVQPNAAPPAVDVAPVFVHNSRAANGVGAPLALVANPDAPAGVHVAPVQPPVNPPPPAVKPAWGAGPLMMKESNGKYEVIQLMSSAAAGNLDNNYNGPNVMVMNDRHLASVDQKVRDISYETHCRFTEHIVDLIAQEPRTRTQLAAASKYSSDSSYGFTYPLQQLRNRGYLEKDGLGRIYLNDSFYLDP